MNRIRFWMRYCVACQRTIALCIKWRSTSFRAEEKLEKGYLSYFFSFYKHKQMFGSQARIPRNFARNYTWKLCPHTRCLMKLHGEAQWRTYSPFKEPNTWKRWLRHNHCSYISSWIIQQFINWSHLPTGYPPCKIKKNSTVCTVCWCM